MSFELIVVDDGSQDTSAAEVAAFTESNPLVTVHVLRHTLHAGRGAAIRTGIERARGEFCLLQDGALRLEARDYQEVLEPLISRKADVVVGSRLLAETSRRPLSFREARTCRSISSLTGRAANLDLSDVPCPIKAFRTALARTVPLYSQGAGIHSEMAIQFSRRHARFLEVPVTHYETNSGGNAEGSLFRLISTLGAVLRTRYLSAAHTDAAADMLVAMSEAHCFNRWMADTIRPYVTGQVIEFGAGLGNLTTLLAESGTRYTATDSDPEHLAELRSRIGSSSSIRVELCDFSNPRNVASYYQSADTVICLNVLEHVVDDVGGLSNLRSCLRPGGKAIILVPQGPKVFGSFDVILEHKRRYTRMELHEKMTASGFGVAQILEFNRVTMPGWMLNSRLLHRRRLSRLQLGIVDRLVPLWRRIDHLLPWPSTSLIAIGVADGA